MYRGPFGIVSYPGPFVGCVDCVDVIGNATQQDKILELHYQCAVKAAEQMGVPMPHVGIAPPIYGV